MIQLTDKVWIGDSDDGKYTDLVEPVVGAVLCVAQDLTPPNTRLWPTTEYAHVGLIDGPGNLPCAYIAAIVTLHLLLDRHPAVLVYCHGGGRALAVTLMYTILRRGKVSDHSTILNHWTPFDVALQYLRTSLGPSCYLPDVHPSHVEAFDKLPLSLLEVLV